MEVQEEQGAGVAAGDSYCLPMSVTAENQPAINMLHSGAVVDGVAGIRHEAGAGSRLAEGAAGRREELKGAAMGGNEKAA